MFSTCYSRNNVLYVTTLQRLHVPEWSRQHSLNASVLLNLSKCNYFINHCVITIPWKESPIEVAFHNWSSKNIISSITWTFFLTVDICILNNSLTDLQNYPNFSEKVYMDPKKCVLIKLWPFNIVFYTVFDLFICYLHLIFCKQGHLFG